MHRAQSFAIVAALALVAGVQAQEDGAAAEDAELTPVTGQSSLRVRTGGQWWFENDYEVYRASVGLSFSSPLDRVTKVVGNVRYDWEFYEFKHGGGGLTTDRSDPWEQINTVGATVGLQIDWDDNLQTTFGGVFIAAWEEGADFQDGILPGGYGEFRYRFAPDFTLGAGAMVIDRLEDGWRVIPRIVIDWEVTNDLRITSLGAGIPNLQGIEAQWDLRGGWTTAVGGGFLYKQFRLDDGGEGPEGVGTETAMPIWWRLTKADEQGAITAFLGMGTDIDLKFEDEDGRTIGDEGKNAAFIMGLNVSFRF